MPARIAVAVRYCNNCAKMFARGFLRSGREEAIEDYRKRKFCSRRCYHEHTRGERHPLYKPGGTVTIFGYVRTTDPDGSGRRGHLHRIMMEKKLGRRLLPDEHVHHKDGNPLNNDIGNLELITNRDHALLHSPLRKRNRKGQYA